MRMGHGQCRQETSAANGSCAGMASTHSARLLCPRIVDEVVAAPRLSACQQENTLATTVGYQMFFWHRYESRTIAYG
jgi:hypothetical protein